MPRTTRSKGGASTSTSTSSPAAIPSNNTANSKFALAPESSTPPKVFILPKKATSEARVVSLQNPRYNKPTRYLVCPESGIYEFTRIAAPKSTPRSWLIECSSGTTSREEETTTENGTDSEFGTYVTKGADLYIATPIDPVFLVLPALIGAQSSSKSEKKLFLSSDDHFDAMSKSASPHLSDILRWDNVRTLLESRMAAICDTVEAGGESMFRLSEEKLLAEVLLKAKKMSKGPLPPSMEEKFITKALEAPVLSVKRENTTVSVTQEKTETEAPESGSSTPKVKSEESQDSVFSNDTATSLVSEAPTTATSVAEETVASIELAAAMTASSEVTQLQRLRTAFNFICSSYIAQIQADQLKEKLTEQKSLVDFSPLVDYLAKVTKLRQDAMASRSMGDYSRKRQLDDEEVMERAEKKRKKEEEEKRKKVGESKGVRDLKKVNTTGMKKMSDFFNKKT